MSSVRIGWIDMVAVEVHLRCHQFHAIFRGVAPGLSLGLLNTML